MIHHPPAGLRSPSEPPRGCSAGRPLSFCPTLHRLFFRVRECRSAKHFRLAQAPRERYRISHSPPQAFYVHIVYILAFQDTHSVTNGVIFSACVLLSPVKRL